MNEECLELAGKVDCLHDGGPNNSSYVSNQFCGGAETAQRSRRKPTEQSVPWIQNFVSPTKLRHTFRVAWKKLGIISPLNNSNGSLNVSHNDGNDVKIPTMKNIPTLRTAQFLN